MTALHPKYMSLREECLGPNFKFNSMLEIFFQRAILDKFYLEDILRQEIKDINEKHLKELLELSIKLSSTIDTNYNLLQQLNHTKDNHGTT